MQCVYIFSLPTNGLGLGLPCTKTFPCITFITSQRTFLHELKTAMSHFPLKADLCRRSLQDDTEERQGKRRSVGESFQLNNMMYIKQPSKSFVCFSGSPGYIGSQSVRQAGSQWVLYCRLLHPVFLYTVYSHHGPLTAVNTRRVQYAILLHLRL